MTPELVRRVEDGARRRPQRRGRGACSTELSAVGQAVGARAGLRARARRAGRHLLKRDLDPEVLTELDEEVRDDVLDQLDSKEIAAAARELETDDAASLLEDLPEEERREVLAELPADERAEIEKRARLSRGQRRPPDAALAGQGAAELERRPGDRLLPRGRRSARRRLRPVRGRPQRPAARLGAARPHAAQQAAGADHSTSSIPTSRRCRRPPTRSEVAHLFRDQNLVSCPVVDDKRPAARRDHGRRRGRRDRRGGRGGPAEDGRRRPRRHARQHRAHRAAARRCGWR